MFWSSEVKCEKTGPSGQLQVVDRGRRRTLFLGSLPQTTIDLSNPDKIAARYIAYLHLGKLFRPQSKRCLFLGLGGGAGVRSFRRTYDDLDVVAVDVDPEVVEVARKFFFIEEDENLSLVVNDARTYLTVRDKSFDIIVLDIYNQDGYPSRLYTRESFQLMHDALRNSGGEMDSCNSGVLVINAVGWLNGRKSETIRIMIKTLKAVFPFVYVFQVRQSFLSRIIGDGGNNFILIAHQGQRKFSGRMLRHRADQLQKKLQPPLSFQKMIKCHEELPYLGDVPVITDKKVNRGEVRLTV